MNFDESVKRIRISFAIYCMIILVFAAFVVCNLTAITTYSEGHVLISHSDGRVNELAISISNREFFTSLIMSYVNLSFILLLLIILIKFRNLEFNSKWIKMYVLIIVSITSIASIIWCVNVISVS